MDDNNDDNRKPSMEELNRVDMPATLNVDGDEPMQERPVMFSAKTSNARLVTSVLNALSSAQNRNKQMATITLASNAFAIIINEGKNFQALARISTADFFTSFSYMPEDESVVESFRINFGTLLQCLNIYGAQTTGQVELEIIYEGYGKPLVLR
jgi:hypothetical protein